MRERVALLLPSLRPPGVLRVAANLAAGLLSDGVDAQLWVGAAQRRGFALPAAAPLVELPAGASLRERAIEQVRRTPVAALIGFTHPANLAALAARAAVQPRARVAVTLHMTLSRFLAGEPGRLRRVAAEIAEQYPAADAVIAVSEGVASDAAALSGLPRDRIDVAPNAIVGADVARLAREPVAHPWFAAGQPPVILGAGRLDPQKDFPTLLRAFRSVRDAREARLVILGEGRERPRLSAEIERLGLAADVALPGRVRNPYRFMARVAAFALSSVHEGLPTALVEALACGAPVASTDCPSGPREILEDGRVGPLVPVGDPAGLAAALLGLLERPPARELLRRAAQRYSVERAVAAYRGLLKLA